ncbi:MAG: site-specific DNA-methyltransferase [Deltaproteobacteria bacterium]|nr:MAG: site-specific DNA-methyltransferase [Deltaproteobacteria bacterium]
MSQQPKEQSLPNGLSLSWSGKEGVLRAFAERTPAGKPALVERYGFKEPDGRLFWGDNLAVMDALLAQEAESFDLIYIDPPFATGDDFSVKLSVGEKGKRPKHPASWSDVQAYHDKWEGASFWSMMYARLLRVHGLLSPTGTLFLHCDHRTDWVLRGMLEEIFGAGQVINQIVWHYTGGGRSKRRISRKYDTIFWVAKGPSWTFHLDEIRVPYKASSGFAKGGITSAAGKKYMPHPDGTPVDDVWDIPIVNPMSRERWDYPTQKPERLLERILRLASSPGDKVADFFCGSGTTLAVAQSLGRRWVGCDQGHWSMHTLRKRLLCREEPASLEVYRVQQTTTPTGPLKVVAKLSERDGSFQVSLEHVEWVGPTALPDDVLALVQAPLDLVDAWTVGSTPNEGIFQGDWYAGRTRDDRTLSPETPWFAVWEGSEVCVRVYDLLGGCTEVVLPLK